MLKGFLTTYHEADTDADPQGGSSGKTRASDLRANLGTQVDEQALTRLLEKHADLLNDNSQLREQRRTLKQQLTDAASKVPGEGARVLTADEANAYDAYAVLGKPADIKQAMDANGTTTAELTALKREKALAKAADAAGFKASVLTTLAGDLDIQTEPTKDGKPIVYVVKDGEKMALTDYAAKEWADFLPALQAQPKQGAPDINAGARSNGNGPTITDEQREQATRRMRATF